MTQPNPDPTTEPDLRTSTVNVRMLDHAGSEIRARDLPPIFSDEKPWNGGKNRGPSPLEIVLGGLGA